MKESIDFGASNEFGAHHFYVVIPPAVDDAVQIFEDYGFNVEESQNEKAVCRITLARELWLKIKEEVRKDFNTRLKVKKESTGSWKIGKTKLDRFLGRELCVLAWASEHAQADECPIICQKWLALRPEERWWLYSKTAAEAGLENQTNRGWRKALYCALSDGETIRLNAKITPKRKKKIDDELDIFSSLEEKEK